MRCVLIEQDQAERYIKTRQESSFSALFFSGGTGAWLFHSRPGRHLADGDRTFLCQFIGLFHPLGDCVFLIGPALFSHPGCLLLHRIPLLPVLQLMLRRVPDFPVYDSLAMVFHQLRLPSLVDLHGDDVSARGLVEELDGYRVVYAMINGRTVVIST